MAGITTFLDESQMPNRSQEQKVFDNLVAYVFQNFPKWGREINESLGSFNAALSGGAYSLPYIFDTTTTDADPGVGRLRLSNSSQNVSTAMRLDIMTTGGVDVSAILDSFDASTSQTKGSIRLTKAADLSKFLLFNVTARTAPSGYRNLSVVCVGGSSANPFASGDALLLHFQRSGDQGASGSLTQVLSVRDLKPNLSGGGTAFPGSWGKRDLNSVVKNSIVGASLANSQITLPAGTYRLDAIVPAGPVNHQAFFADVTNGSSFLAMGNSVSSNSSMTTLSIIGKFEFTIATTRVFEIQHWTNTNHANYGLGYPAGSTNGEIFTQVFIEKVS
jgi:hypothetical protein